MKKSNVVIALSAYQDLDRIFDFLMEKSPSAARNFYNGLMDAYQKLEDFPLMGTGMQELSLRCENYRKLIVGDYITLYRFISGTCYIDHVFHGKQDYGACFLEQ